MKLFELTTAMLLTTMFGLSGCGGSSQIPDNIPPQPPAEMRPAVVEAPTSTATESAEAEDSGDGFGGEVDFTAAADADAESSEPTSQPTEGATQDEAEDAGDSGSSDQPAESGSGEDAE